MKGIVFIIMLGFPVLCFGYMDILSLGKSKIVNLTRSYLFIKFFWISATLCVLFSGIEWSLPLVGLSGLLNIAAVWVLSEYYLGALVALVANSSNSSDPQHSKIIFMIGLLAADIIFGICTLANGFVFIMFLIT